MTDIQIFLLIACRDNLRYVVPPGGLVTKTLRNHDFTVSQVFSSIHVDTISLNHVNTVPPFASARPPHSYIPIAPFSRPHVFSLLQIRRLQYVLECNHKMLKVIVQVRSTPSSKKGKTSKYSRAHTRTPQQIHTYNALGSDNVSLVKRQNTLRRVSEYIQSALGLRDHRQQKLVTLAIASGCHFGRSIKVEPKAPVGIQTGSSISPRHMDLSIDPETLLWEEVPGYSHRIPCILTTIKRGMHELDAFRTDNVFGFRVPTAKLREIRQNLEDGHETTVDHGGLLAALLKHWLEELPMPLLQVDGPDGYLMKEVLQGTNATPEHIHAVLTSPGNTPVEQSVFNHVLNLLAVTVESNPDHNSPYELSTHLMQPLCHKQRGSRTGNLARTFVEQIIRYQVESRRCHPQKFVPLGSISPVQRKFLTKMLFTADNMHEYLGRVGELERTMTNDDLIRTVNATPKSKSSSHEVSHASSAPALASTPEQLCSSDVDDSDFKSDVDDSDFKTPASKPRRWSLRKRLTRRKKKQSVIKSGDSSLTGIYTLEAVASPFHIPAELLRPFYKDWEVRTPTRLRVIGLGMAIGSITFYVSAVIVFLNHFAVDIAPHHRKNTAKKSASSATSLFTAASPRQRPGWSPSLFLSLSLSLVRTRSVTLRPCLCRELLTRNPEEWKKLDAGMRVSESYQYTRVQ